MSLLKIVFLVCVLVVTAKALSDEERQAMFFDMVNNCKAQEGATDADVQEIATQQIPSTRSGQCLQACIFESAGMIKDGKLSVEGSVKIAELTENPARIKNVETICRDCESTVGADRCDLALQVVQCLGKSAAAHGFDPTKDLL